MGRNRFLLEVWLLFLTLSRRAALVLENLPLWKCEWMVLMIIFLGGERSMLLRTALQEV